jgi:Fe-S-cluster-containing dehydrogenase component/anaerobic selenocysteine-containing dehydrogenase
MSDDHEREPPASRQEMTRREALKVLLAGVAAVKAGCMKAPGDEVRPYVELPAELRPGTPSFYATSMTIDGFASGLLVESHEGRPTKIEGNPLHPANLGATNAQQQASILELYDPHRAKAAAMGGASVSWARLAARLTALPEGPLWLVTSPQSSPLVGRLLTEIREKHRDARIVQSVGLDHRNTYRGAELAFGRALELQLDLTRADVLVCLDADPLDGMAFSVRWARDFAVRRRLDSPSDSMGRLHVVEPMVTPTGSLADHRLALPAGGVLAIAMGLLEELRRRGRPAPELPAGVRERFAAQLDDRSSAFVRATAGDLVRNGPTSAVVVGDRQPPVCHVIGHLLNAAIGSEVTSLTEPALLDPLGGPSLADLAAALRADEVGSVVIIETNPVYTAANLDLAELLPRAPFSLHSSLHRDETSRVCRAFAPASHFLESWGDARAWDGTPSLVQPLVRPLYDTRSTVELLALLAGDRTPDARTLLRERWDDSFGGTTFEEALALGFAKGAANAPVRAAPTLTDASIAALANAAPADDALGLELDLAPSAALYDGRFANNPWLEELPRPITKLTWGNAAMLAPRTAERLGIEAGRIVRLTLGERTVEVPALPVRGHAEGCVTLELGYGRDAPEQPIADGVGANGYLLMRSPTDRVVGGLEVRVTDRHARLAVTQQHFLQHGREIAPIVALTEYRNTPQRFAALRGPLPTLLLESPTRAERDAPQWAMTIDTMICTGCSACVVACQAENNVPVVGPEGVRRNREMHWLRIDTYFAGDDDALAIVHQPMLCQHCEHAPCEYVCPVFATSHSPDGLNEMTYNRCIGTRFCSNNCPYKVRRFNFFNYTDEDTTVRLQRNPDVTVRDRGVMEKCTYCVQRIRAAEIEARMENRRIAEGEVVTACQQACPTRAIQFGALEHVNTEMVRWRKQPRAYAVLHELGTRPRTMYLAKVLDPPDDGRGEP